jgi:hypothetical protein
VPLYSRDPTEVGFLTLGSYFLSRACVGALLSLQLVNFVLQLADRFIWDLNIIPGFLTVLHRTTSSDIIISDGSKSTSVRDGKFWRK